MVHTSIFGKVWEIVKYLEILKWGLTWGVFFGKIEKNRIIWNLCEGSMILGMPKNGRFGANTYPAQK